MEATDEQGRAILEAASVLLADDGPEALTVRRIARAAGCSTMCIYSRFGNKDGVVDRLFAEGFERLRACVDDPLSGVDPVGDLRAGALAYRANALAHATEYLVMFGAAVPGFVPSPESKASAHAAFDGLVARVQRCIDAGAFSGSASEIAQLYLGVVHGHVMLELAGIDPAGIDQSVGFEDGVDVLLAGLAAAGTVSRASTRAGTR